MTRVREAWDRFWFSPLDALPAAVFRIALGAVMVALYLAFWTNWDRYFGADGILSMHDPAVTARPQDWWSLFNWTDGTVPIGLYWWIGLLAAAGFTLGWRTRACTVALFVLWTSQIHRDTAVGNGEDLVIRMLLFYACFARLDTALALAARRRPGSSPPAVWPIRLMQINVCLIYVFTQVNKLAAEPLWRSGDALYQVAALSAWSRWPGPGVFYDRWSAALATYGSLAIEIAFPLLVWVRGLRRVVVVAILALHVGIVLMLRGVVFFNLAMMSGVLLFVTSEDLHALGASCRRAGWEGARRLAISAACCLSLVTAVVINLPSALDPAAVGSGAPSPVARAGDRLRAAFGPVLGYAHLLAHDGRWLMFSGLPRFDWWLRFSARYADGSARVLPSPLRPTPPRLPRAIADHRESKFQLNLYGDPAWREAYARYLCRTLAGSGLSAIAIELRHRIIIPRPNALARGDHRAPVVQTTSLETVPCPAAR